MGYAGLSAAVMANAASSLFLSTQDMASREYWNMKRIDVYPIGRERTEEEKRRRHIYGDKGATFSKGKQPCLLKSGVIGCITTFATKDNLICEVYEED